MNLAFHAISNLELIKPPPPQDMYTQNCPVGYKQDASNYQVFRRSVVWNVNTQQWDVGAYYLAEFNCQPDTFIVWTPNMKWDFTTVVSSNGYNITVQGIFRMGVPDDPSDWQLEINAYCPELIGRGVHLYWDKYTRDIHGKGDRLVFGADGWARTGIRHTRMSSGKHNIKSNERCAVAVEVV